MLKLVPSLGVKTVVRIRRHVGGGTIAERDRRSVDRLCPGPRMNHGVSEPRKASVSGEALVRQCLLVTKVAATKLITSQFRDHTVATVGQRFIKKVRYGCMTCGRAQCLEQPVSSTASTRTRHPQEPREIERDRVLRHVSPKGITFSVSKLKISKALPWHGFSRLSYQSS